MKISVTLRCACGTEIEEIPDVVCEKTFENVQSHKHGKCPACEHPMVCVCETLPPHMHEGYN